MTYLVIVIIDAHYLVGHWRTDAKHTWIIELHTISHFGITFYDQLTMSTKSVHDAQQPYTREKNNTNNIAKLKQQNQNYRNWLINYCFFCLRYRQMGRVSLTQAVCDCGMEDCELHVWGAGAEIDQYLQTIHTHALNNWCHAINDSDNWTQWIQITDLKLCSYNVTLLL